MNDNEIDSGNASTFHPSLESEEQINRIYEQYRLKNNTEGFERIQIWTYYRIQSIFMELYLSGEMWDSSSVEAMISKAYFTFLNKHRQITQFNAFTRWVRRMCLRIGYKYFSSEIRIEPTDDDEKLDRTIEFDESFAQELDDEIFLNAILTEIQNTLPPRMYETLRYKFLTDMSLQEIADKMNISTQTVKNYYTRALKILRSSNIIKTMILNKLNNEL
jgi:RNA polymerase sigma factor (sigma-70 family)